MKKTVSIVALLTLAAVSGFAASPPQSDSITVTATNGGVFTFNIVAASYGFGTVDAAGTAAVGPVGPAPTPTTNAGGAIYTTAGATTWTCASAPSRTVRVFNASTTSVINWGTADRLEMQIPTTGLGTGTSCNYKVFSAVGDGGAASCTSGNLVHTVTVGNGANSVTGNLDFRLTVANADVTGTNTWTVVLTATGS